MCNLMLVLVESNIVCHWRLSKVSETSTAYLLQNVNSKRYLNVEGGSTRNGANVQQWGTQSVHSQWQVHRVSEETWQCHEPQNADSCPTVGTGGVFEYFYFGAGGPCDCNCCKRELYCESVVPGGVQRNSRDSCKCKKVVVDGQSKEPVLTGTGYYHPEHDPCRYGNEGNERYFNTKDLIGKGCTCRLN